MNKIFSAMIFWALAQYSCAQANIDQIKQNCSESILRVVGVQLGIENFAYSSDGGILVAGVCKVWPADTAKTIAAFAHDINGDAGQKALHVFLINHQSSIIEASYQGTIEGVDAYYLRDDSLKIDTARYALAPGIRAFGIDITPTGYNPGERFHEGGSGSVRKLFVTEGTTLKSVLDEFYLSGWRLKGGSGLCYLPGDADTKAGKAWAKVRRIEKFYSIEVSKAVTHGYANLIISEATEVRNCDGKVLQKLKPSNHRREMRYDGDRYH